MLSLMNLVRRAVFSKWESNRLTCLRPPPFTGRGAGDRLGSFPSTTIPQTVSHARAFPSTQTPAPRLAYQIKLESSDANGLRGFPPSRLLILRHSVGCSPFTIEYGGSAMATHYAKRLR